MGVYVVVVMSPNIGSRWRPGQVERRDTAAGTFECVNPVDLSNDALWVQQAVLLPPAQPPRRFSPSGASLIVYIAAVLAVLCWLFLYGS